MAGVRSGPLDVHQPDEQLAVARFRQWEAKGKGSNLGTLKVHTSARAAWLDLCARTIGAGGSLDPDIARPKDGPKGVWAVTDETLSPKQWAWLRQQIIDRPQWVAQTVEGLSSAEGHRPDG